MPKLTKYASLLLLLLLLPLLLRAADDIVLPDTALPMAEREAAFKKTAMAYIRPVTDVNAAKNAIAAKRIADPPSVGQDVHRWFRDTLAAFENACGCRINIAAGMTDHFWANTFKEQRDAPLVTDGTACQLGFRLLYARLGERDKATYTLMLHDTLTQAARDMFPQGKLDTLFATLAAFKETLSDVAQTKATTAISNALWALLEGGYKHDPKYSATLALKDKNSLLLPDTCPAPALAQDYPGGARYYGVATGQALGYTLSYKTGADNPDNIPLLLHRPDGAEVPATTTGSVTATAEGEADVYAFYRLEGKYTTQNRILENTRHTLVANSPKELKLVLVPVQRHYATGPGAAIPTPEPAALRQELNRIYAPAAVEWLVDKAEPFTHEALPTEGLSTKSALVSAYSPDMNALIKAYKKKVKSWEDDTYYLFAVPRFAEPSVSGYMPLQSAFGFVASDNPTTLAHELGHGAFTLKHTWLQWPALTPSSTLNLMDYNNGAQLWKPQWDMVHNQKYHISWFDEDEDKMAKGFFFKDVMFWDVAEYVYRNEFADIYSVESRPSDEVIDVFTITPHYNVDIDGSKKISYYLATREIGADKYAFDYVIGTDAIDNFRNKVVWYRAASNMFHVAGKPSESQLRMLAGAYSKSATEALAGLGNMWADALTNPEWWISLGLGVFAPEANFSKLNQAASTTLRTFKNVSSKAVLSGLNQMGALGYKVKTVGVEVALYSRLNIEIARFNTGGVLRPTVWANPSGNYKVIRTFDDISYAENATYNSTKTATLEVVEDVSTGSAAWRIVVKNSNDAANLFVNGWTKEKILAEVARRKVTNLPALTPTEYLSAEYIANHLKQFEGGVSYIVPKSVLDSRGRTLIGRPDGQFIMTKIEMNDLIKKANGSLTIIETELGIPAGAWKGEELIRIDIAVPKQLELRMATGSESGANIKWQPGGTLPNGYSEAIINQIPQGKYVETQIIIK